MEEKRINERESLELITRMIADTRSRIETRDGNIVLNWGLLSVAVAAIVWIALVTTGNPGFNGLWGLIALGYLFNRKEKKAQRQKGYTSFTDRISNRLWIPVMVMAVVSFAVCAVFDIVLEKNLWKLMFTFPFIFVGFASSVHGYVIDVKSLVYGGMLNMAVGIVLSALLMEGIRLDTVWAMPLFIVCMTTLMIIPGLEMKHLARRGHEKS